MDGRTTGIIVAVIIILAGAWFLFARGPVAEDPGANPGTTPVTTTTTTTTTTPTTPTVTYTDQGFSPQSVTVAVGSTVTFVDNSSALEMWVGSAAHPTHQAYDGTAMSAHCAAGYTGPKPFDQCMAAASYSFTFTKAGTWRYHNHRDASHSGTVVVTAPAAATNATTTVNVGL